MTQATPVPAAEDPETLRRETQKILKRHGTRRAELIPILQDVQKKLGYLPSVSLKEIAAHLDIPPVDVYGVVTFYNQFRLNPPGRDLIVEVDTLEQRSELVKAVGTPPQHLEVQIDLRRDPDSQLHHGQSFARCRAERKAHSVMSTSGLGPADRSNPANPRPGPLGLQRRGLSSVWQPATTPGLPESGWWW